MYCSNCKWRVAAARRVPKASVTTLNNTTNAEIPKSTIKDQSDNNIRDRSICFEYSPTKKQVHHKRKSRTTILLADMDKCYSKRGGFSGIVIR